MRNREFSGIFVGGQTGQAAHVDLAAADTASAPASDSPNGAYEYAVRITKAGDVITTFRGRLILGQDLFG